MKNNTCCFTGHRSLPTKKIDRIMKCLDHEIETLINQGVTTFLSGGAVGFDQIAASLIISKKELGANIRLVFILPCRNQSERWTEEQQRLYKSLLNEAEEIHYISEEYTDQCISCISVLPKTYVNKVNMERKSVKEPTMLSAYLN